MIVRRNSNTQERKWQFKLMYVPELASYAMKGTTHSDSSEYEKHALRYAFERETVGGENKLRKAIRIYLPVKPDAIELIEKTFSDAFRYLRTGYVRKSEIEESLERLKRALRKLDLRGEVHQEKGNKLTATIHLGDRKQNISVCLYEGMIFLSSRIGRMERIVIDGRPLDDEHRLLRLNNSTSFGYFSLHDGFVTLCKRLFWHDYNAEFVSKTIMALAEKADLHELKFIGPDRL